MATRAKLAVLVAALLPLSGRASRAQNLATTPAKQIRILFIGNSLTYVNDLPAELKALAAVAYPGGPALRYESVTPGGCTLKKHWNDGKAVAKIAEGHWDYVVLQEQSQIPFTDREQMYQYARLLDQEIKKAGAKTVLYMTFPLKKKFADGDLLPEIYTALGKELGAIVVPVDVAWHEAAKRDPNIVLYKADGVHPAAAGTYLAACCFSDTLWGKPASRFPAKLLRGNQADKPLVELDETQAGLLQKAAAAVVFSDSNSIKTAVGNGGKPVVPKSVHAPPTNTRWVDLFNGQDTSGWLDAHNLWKVENGVLIGAGGHGFLDTKRNDFANVDIRVEAMINDRGNSGVLFRANPGSAYEAQIEANGGDRAKTGSLYVYDGKRITAKVRLKESPVPANQWFAMEIVAEGFHITILVDGKQVADYQDDDRVASRGPIRLQVNDAGTVVKFRKVQIRELPPTEK